MRLQVIVHVWKGVTNVTKVLADGHSVLRNVGYDNTSWYLDNLGVRWVETPLAPRAVLCILHTHCMCAACNLHVCCVHTQPACALRAHCAHAACTLRARCVHAACAGGTRSTPTSRAAACPTRSARRSSAGTARCGERPWTRRTCSRRCGRGSQPSPRSFGRHVLRRPTPVPRRRASRASAASSTSAASRQHQWPMLWRAVRPPVLARAWHSVVAAAAEPREGVRYYVRSQEGETAPLASGKVQRVKPYVQGLSICDLCIFVISLCQKTLRIVDALPLWSWSA